tara:strand:+ start:183 stop:641 length:459 start_codon:yes stop_codon:yes gene_type:complete
MFKKISLLLLLCSLLSCGYQPLYQNENDFDKPINNFNFEGDKRTNKIIISFLGLKKVNNSKKGYSLTLKNKKIIDVVSKDKNGNPSVYKMSLMVNLILSDNDKILKKKEFKANFIYNNTKNKFGLSQYQKNIETNLINELSEKIFIFLRTKK